jgi:hypothetical protein
MSIALCEVTSKLNEPATTLRGDYSQRIKRAIQYARKVPGVTRGGRNPAGYKLVTAIREKFDIADSDMLGVLRDWNSCNTPPLDDNELAELIPNANKYAKKPAGSGYEPIESGKKKQASKQQKPGRRIQRRCFSNITPCEIEYIVPEILPKGVLVSLISQEGVGKSTEASHIAAIVSTGGDWPNSFDTTMQGDVVIFSHEESPEHSIAPRLIANGADMSRIHLGESVISTDGTEDFFNFEFDIDVLSDWADELPDLRLIIFDPITSYTNANENSNSEVRGALKPLIDFAARRGVTVLMLSHLSKKVDLGMINRTIGSRAWSAVPRMIWGLQPEMEEDEDGNKVDTNHRFLLCVKCNLGKKPQGMKFFIGDGGKVTFDTQRFDHDIDSSGGMQSSRSDEIGQWLIDRIGEFSTPQKDLAAEAKEKWSINSSRLGKIATLHGVGKRYSRAQSCWVWSVK